MNASSRALVVGIIGKDGRSSAIERALRRDPRVADVVCLAEGKEKERADLFAIVSAAVERHRPAFVVVGPEEPLACGVVEYLRDVHGIPSVGPTSPLARLESSKAFTRQLVDKYGIEGNPRYRVFSSIDGIEDFLIHLGRFVVKPDGLTGGKGVKVSGEHLHSIRDGLEYCRELLREPGASVVIEERLDGEEFSLQSFCDGQRVVHMPLVQDHKRAYDGDAGPNTGGMGSYSCADHGLPFIASEAVALARRINEQVAAAVLEETGEEYKGILFGGFMLTRDGVRLLEYNVRFGDPEALNVLSILETSFLEICERIIQGTLEPGHVRFRRAATVCKYLVPQGYPNEPVSGEMIDLTDVPHDSVHLMSYRAAVRQIEGKPYRVALTGSRALALVGIADTLARAELIAEKAAAAVEGKVRHRRDIGTNALVQRRIEHMRELTASHLASAVAR